MESKHAAIDAMGNVLRIIPDDSALHQPISEKDIGLSALSSLGGNSSSSVEESVTRHQLSDEAENRDTKSVRATIFSSPLWQDDVDSPLHEPLSPSDLKNYQIRTYLQRCALRGELIETNMELMSDSSKDAIYRRLRLERLGAVQNEAIYVLLENLKLCTARGRKHLVLVQE